MMKAASLVFFSLAGTVPASNSGEQCRSDGAPVCSISPCDNLPSWANLTSEQRYEYEDDWTETTWEQNRALGKDYDYEDLMWIHICDEEKAKLIAEGWNEEKWEQVDELITLKYLSSVSVCDSLPSWANLTEEQRDDYEEDGWTQETWEKNRASGKNYVYDDLMWVHICDEDKAKLRAKGWKKEYWGHVDEVFAWDDLSPEQRAYLDSLGVTEKNFDSSMWDIYSDPHHWDMHSPGKEFSARVIKTDIPDLQKLDIEHLKTIDADVGVVSSSAAGPNEDWVGEITLEDYIVGMLSGDETRYVQLEDQPKYKALLRLVLGDAVIKSIPEALVRNEIEEFTQELQNLKHDWSLFLGGKGSSTAMHFDTDRFNFLYVVEGRKRIVLIPNKGLADQTYQPKSFYDGSGWTGVDILSDLDGLPDDAVVLELGPGEGVAIPYRAWHAVENLDNTLAYGLRIP